MRPALKTLNNKQLLQLDSILQSFQMSIEKLDGFFAALYISTTHLLPSDYFSYVFGDTPTEISSVEEIQTTLDLIMGLWNDISNRFQEGLFIPLLKKGESLQDQGINNWAQGFLDGLKISEGFKEFLEDESKEGHMIPLFMFSYEHHCDPELRPSKEPIIGEQREDLFNHLIASVNTMYRFNLQFKAPLSNPKKVKIARNDPCPCGSGKKYKKCCL